jgi:hypothetical protein
MDKNLQKQTLTGRGETSLLDLLHLQIRQTPLRLQAPDPMAGSVKPLNSSRV